MYLLSKPSHILPNIYRNETNFGLLHEGRLIQQDGLTLFPIKYFATSTLLFKTVAFG